MRLSLLIPSVRMQTVALRGRLVESADTQKTLLDEKIYASQRSVATTSVIVVWYLTNLARGHLFLVERNFRADKAYINGMYARHTYG